MKVLIPFAALFLGLSHSQDLSGQPACATNCIISAVSAAGCAPSDISCQCGTTKDIIAASAAPCLLASCAATELLQAQSAGNAQCSRFAATAVQAMVTSGLNMENMPADSLRSPKRQIIVDEVMLVMPTKAVMEEHNVVVTIVKPTDGGNVVQRMDQGSEAGEQVFYSRIPLGNGMVVAVLPADGGKEKRGGEGGGENQDLQLPMVTAAPLADVVKRGSEGGGEGGGTTNNIEDQDWQVASGMNGMNRDLVSPDTDESGLRLLNEATTAKVTTTATSTHTSTSTSYTTYKPAVSAGPAASLKVGLSGLLGVAGVIFAGL